MVQRLKRWKAIRYMVWCKKELGVGTKFEDFITIVSI
jgi:hypothetical protein